MGRTVSFSLLAGLLCALFCCCARKTVPPGPSGEAPALSPLETMRLYRQYLKSGNIDGVKSLLARGLRDATGEEDIDGMVRHSRGWVEGGSDFAVLEAKEEGDTAIVIVNKFLKGGRQTVDIDPIPLLRQEGTWKIVPHIMALGEDRLKAVANLGEWYNERKEQLKIELIKRRRRGQR